MQRTSVIVVGLLSLASLAATRALASVDDHAGSVSERATQAAWNEPARDSAAFAQPISRGDIRAGFEEGGVIVGVTDPRGVVLVLPPAGASRVSSSTAAPPLHAKGAAKRAELPPKPGPNAKRESAKRRPQGKSTA